MLVGAFMKTAYSVIIYSMLTLSCLGAGWDTNAWSGTYHRYYLDASTNKVFIKEALSSDAFAACTERAVIAQVTAPTTNAWYRSNRADLVNIKSWINSNADEFYITNVWVESDYISFVSKTNTTSWRDCGIESYEISGLYTNSQLSKAITVDESLLRWSSSSLLSALSLPTNYLTYTPWRKLTDSNTTNGWHAIDDLLNKLIYPVVTFTWVNKDGINGKSDPDITAGDVVWSDIKDLAVANEVSSSSDPQKWSFGHVYPFCFVDGGNTLCQCGFWAEYKNTYANPRASLSSNTNYTANVDFYVYMHEYYSGTEFQSTTVEFEPQDMYDAQGTAYTSNAVWLVASSTNVYGLHTNTTDIGDSAKSQPTWVAAPDGSPGTTDAIEDWWFNSNFWHFKFSGWISGSPLVSADYTTSSSPITYYAD